MKRKFLIAFILLLGLILRLHNYANYPQRGASSDEYTYSFMGISLLQKGVPTSWSNFAVYERLGKKEDLTVNNLYFPLVTPYFDHPPFNGLIVGAWAIANGEGEFKDIKLSTIRLVPIFLGVLTSYLVYRLSKKLYDEKTAIFALLIYSVSTIIVMNTRVVFAENLLTPLLLISILIFLSIKKRATLWQILLLGIISGIAFWTKELGVSVFVTILALFIHEKVKPFPILLTIIFSVFFLGYGLYGYTYNWELFVNIISAQSGREIGPQTLQMLLFNPIIVNKPYFDGWYFLGFVSFFASFKDFDKHKFILFPSFIYFFFLLFSLTRHGEMGWYVIVLFPFFSILTANILVESIRNKGWFIFALITFVGLYIIRYGFEEMFGLSNPQYRTIMILLFLPLLIPFILKKEKLFTKISYVYFFLFIFMTFLLTYNYIHPA